MNRSERKIRNRSFLALLLAAAMFFSSGTQVFAAQWSMDCDNGNFIRADGYVAQDDIVQAGDSIDVDWGGNYDFRVKYKYGNTEITPDVNIAENLIVRDYPQNDRKYCWRITGAENHDSGNVKNIEFTLVPVYKINYEDMDGVTLNGVKPEFHIGINMYDSDLNPVNAIPGATKKGFIFNGWEARNPENGATDYIALNNNVFDGLTFGDHPDVDYYVRAKWIPINYGINFDVNGGSVEKDSQRFTANDVDTKVDAAYDGTKEGCIFKGWNTQQDGSGIDITADTLVTSLIDRLPVVENPNVTVSITLFAQWAPGYTVKFNKNGGTGDDMEDQLFEIGEEKALSANTYTYEGKTFAGWVENATDTVAKYADGATVKDLTETAGATVELYALWTEENQQFTISFNPGGGLGRMDDITVDAGADVVLPANTFTWDSFVFAAWIDDNNKTYADKAKIENVNRNMTLTAMWKEDDSKNNAGNNKDPKGGKTFRIYYSLPMGAVNPPENPKGYSPGEEINHFADPYMTGYAFIGWYKDSKFTEPVTSIRKTDAGDLVLYARFAKNPLTIGFAAGLETDIYSPNGGEAFKEIGDRLPAAGFSIKKGETITLPGTEYNTAEEEIVYVSSKGMVYWAGEQYSYLMAVEDADENGYVEMKAFVIPVAVGDDKAEVTKVKQVGKHAAKVTWKITDPSSVDGYLLYYKSDKKGSSWKCEVVDSKTKLNAKVKKLKGSDTWYFKVAAYKKVKTADGGWHLDISETGSAKKVTLK